MWEKEVTEIEQMSQRCLLINVHIYTFCCFQIGLRRLFIQIFQFNLQNPPQVKQSAEPGAAWKGLSLKHFPTKGLR